MNHTGTMLFEDGQFTHLKRNTCIFLSHSLDGNSYNPLNSSIESMDRPHLSSQLNQSSVTTSDRLANLRTNNPRSNSLEAITNVINNFLAPSFTSPHEKRRFALERPHGESLTSIEALHKINQKEKRSLKRKKATAAAKKATKITKAPTKRYDIHESDRSESFDINGTLVKSLIELNKTGDRYKLVEK